jgi:RND family efflux transporter MFP subunit
MPNRSKISKIWLATGLAIVVIASAGFVGRDKLAQLLPPDHALPHTAAERPAQPVRVTRVTFTAPDVARQFTGTVRPQHETAMAFRLPGKIISRKVEAGDRVVSGQVLAQMDDTDLRLSLEAAEAEVTASRTDHDRAAAELARSQKLFASGFLARAALDTATSTAAQAQARVDRAQRSRDQAANALSYATLVADAPGVVTAVAADAGQVVAAGQPVVTLAPTDKLDVVFALPEQQRQAVEKARASAVLWGGTAKPYDLLLRDISPDVDPAARTYRVRMSLVAPDGAAALGRTMTVTLQEPAVTPVAQLPLAAVVDNGSGAFVWRLPRNATAVERVPVDVIRLDDASAEVNGALADGDLVVSLGAHKLDPARPVHVVETDAAASM